jgi:hypothetical protein
LFSLSQDFFQTPFTYTATKGLKSEYSIIEQSPDKCFLILSDSLSCLKSLENRNLQNPVILEIIERLHKVLSSGLKISFIWVPSHIGIAGNTAADAIAKAALSLQLSETTVPYSDDDAPDFLVELAPDRSAPALPAQAASASGESRASVSHTEEQSGVGEAVAAASPEAQPQSTSSDDAVGHAAGGADAEATPEGIDPQDVFLPVVLAVVRVFPQYSADVMTARLAATSATVPLPNVRAMVRTAIAAEQSLALRLQQMIAYGCPG